MDKKYLILNADDFGMCHSYNEAVFHLLEEKKISSATLMPVTPGRDEAVSWCLRNRVKCVGLHTTFTSEWDPFRWSSLTRHPSLEDKNGFLYKDVKSFLLHADSGAIYKELEAQFAFFEETGIFFSHADNHMGSIYPNPAFRIPGYLPKVFEFCHKYGRLPFRMFCRFQYDEGALLSADAFSDDIALAGRLGITLVDTLYSYPFLPKEDETYSSFKEAVTKLLYSIPGGIHELYFHPSVASEEIRRIVPSWQRRVWEFELLCDEDFSYALKDAGIQLINYQEMKKLRQESGVKR